MKIVIATITGLSFFLMANMCVADDLLSTITPGARSIEKEGTLLYLSNGDIYNVSDPINPMLIGPGNQYNLNEFNIYGTNLFGHYATTVGGYLNTYDISNPASIGYLTQVDLQRSSNKPSKIVTNGGYTYVGRIS